MRIGFSHMEGVCFDFALYNNTSISFLIILFDINDGYITEDRVDNFISETNVFSTISLRSPKFEFKFFDSIAGAGV